MFWSEIGSGFGEPDGTPPPRILRNTLPGIVPYVCRPKGTVLSRFGLKAGVDFDKGIVFKRTTIAYKRISLFIFKRKLEREREITKNII